jgi:hypothetical protein
MDFVRCGRTSISRLHDLRERSGIPERRIPVPRTFTQVGPEQDAFIDFFERQLRPALTGRKAA